MSVNRFTLAVQWAREAAEGSLADSGAVECRPIDSAFTVASGVYQALLAGSAGVPPPDLLGMDTEIVGVDLLVTSSAGTVWSLKWSLGQGTNWVLNGVPTANTSVAVVQANNPLVGVSAGPVSRVQIDGAVETAIAAGAAATPATCKGTVYYRRPTNLWGRGTFSDYVDSAEDPDFAFSVINALKRINEKVVRSGVRYPLGTASTGAALVAEDCTFAAPSGDRRIFLTAADLGNNPEQIPQSVGQNTVGHFAFFPGAFFRRTDYVRALNSETPDTVGINVEFQNFQPYRLMQVNRKPTQSQWFIIVDGTPHTVWVDHLALDLRRARDIWNRIWVPAISHNQASLQPLKVNVRQNQDPEAMDIDATGLISRLRYLQYAAMIDIADRGETAITTDVTQNDTASVG